MLYKSLFCLLIPLCFHKMLGTSMDTPDLSTNTTSESNVVLMFPSNDSVCYNQTRYVTKTKYEEVRECKEIYTKKCFKESRTEYQKSKIKVCKESFKEDCDINYHYEVHPRNIKICEEEEDPCDPSDMCADIVETECHRVVLDSMSDMGDVECKPVTKRICAPSNCTVQEKRKSVCRNSTQALIQEIPRERCKLTPITNCKNETKLLPRIREETVCQNIPSDICVNLKRNPVRKRELEVQMICSSGSWSNYGNWSDCSAECGVGFTTRKRNCTGGHCVGKAIQSGICRAEKECETQNEGSADINTSNSLDLVTADLFSNASITAGVVDTSTSSGNSSLSEEIKRPGTDFDSTPSLSNLASSQEDVMPSTAAFNANESLYNQGSDNQRPSTSGSNFMENFMASTLNTTEESSSQGSNGPMNGTETANGENIFGFTTDAFNVTEEAMNSLSENQIENQGEMNASESNSGSPSNNGSSGSTPGAQTGNQGLPSPGMVMMMLGSLLSNLTSSMQSSGSSTTGSTSSQSLNQSGMPDSNEIISILGSILSGMNSFNQNNNQSGGLSTGATNQSLPKPGMILSMLGSMASGLNPIPQTANHNVSVDNNSMSNSTLFGMSSTSQNGNQSQIVTGESMAEVPNQEMTGNMMSMFGSLLSGSNNSLSQNLNSSSVLSTAITGPDSSTSGNTTLSSSTMDISPINSSGNQSSMKVVLSPAAMDLLTFVISSSMMMNQMTMNPQPLSTTALNSMIMSLNSLAQNGSVHQGMNDLESSGGTMASNQDSSSSNSNNDNGNNTGSTMTQDSNSGPPMVPTLEALEIEEDNDECLIRGVRLHRASGSWEKVMNIMSLSDCKRICGGLKDCKYFTYIETPKSGKCILLSTAASFETSIEESSVSISGAANCIIPHD